VYKKILVPLDGSKLSELSLKHLSIITSGCRTCQVTLLTVVEKPVTPVPMYMTMQEAREAIPAKMQEKAEKQVKKKAKDYLTKAAKTLKDKGVTIQNMIVEPELAEGVAETILNYAKDNKVELIIMGTHGRSGVLRWALGSVTDKIVRYSIAPVLTVSPAGSRKS
jgi:nucleotide-binding universal stress UspA family protein